MHPKSNPGQAPDDLVLEQLPNGQHAWLKPERDRRFILPSRYWLTDQGYRYLAEQRSIEQGPGAA